MAVDDHSHFVSFPIQVESNVSFEKLVFRWSVSLAMLEFFQKAQTGGREIMTQDTVSPIEGIQMDDGLREKAVDIGQLVRHEELQEFLEGLKHHRKAFMLNATAMRLMQGRGVATTARIGQIPGMELGPC